MAGMKPDEVFAATFKEVLAMIEAYDQDRMDFFNLNTRVAAYYSAAPHVEKMPSFDNFLTLDKDASSPESLTERAARIRELYYQQGYLKRPEA